MHMQVLDQQLVFMCEGVQSDLPYSTKCEKYTVSKTIYKTCSQLLLFFISLSLFLGSPKQHMLYTYKDLVPSFRQPARDVLL